MIETAAAMGAVTGAHPDNRLLGFWHGVMTDMVK